MDQAAKSVFDWAQFGLGGVVIASLFGVLGYAIRLTLTSFKSITDDHEKNHRALRDEHVAERREILESHRAERDQWRESNLKHQADMKLVCEKLTDAIHKLSPKDVS